MRCRGKFFVLVVKWLFETMFESISSREEFDERKIFGLGVKGSAMTDR